MSAYTDGLNEVAQIAFCTLAARGVVGGLLFAGLTAETVLGALGGLAVSAVSAHLYASYCGHPMPPEERGDVPFEGGQCPGVPYRIAISFNLILAPKGSNVDVGRTGVVFDAVGAVTLAEAYDTGDFDNDIRCRASWNGGSADVSVVKGTNADEDNPQWGYRNIIVEITRPDGLPDVCGNPPLVPPTFPPGGNVINNNFTYTDNSGNTYNFPVTLRFGLPRIDTGGEFTMPVTINFDNDPTLNIGGDVNFNTGDFTINVGGGSPPPGIGTGDPDNITRPTTNPPTTPPGVPPNPDPDPTPEPPTIPTDPPTTPPKTKTYKVIRGVIVTTSPADGASTIIFQGDTPDIYAPSLGYISFLCRVGSAYGWTTDIPVKNRQQLIECPWKYGAIDVKGTPKPGAAFSLDPIYDELPQASYPT